MAVDGYLHALAAAQMVVPEQASRGITVWRENGISSAELMLAAFLGHLGQFIDVAVTEHPAIIDGTEYQSIFGTYRNVVSIGPRKAGEGSPALLRPDNLHLNVAQLRSGTVTAQAVVAKGGVIRSLKAKSMPLFRDCYIWPAVQGTQLVARHGALQALHQWRRAVEATFESIGLPVLTVQPTTPPSYGRVCWLVLTHLPDGRPTVLATLYLLSDEYRRALKVSQNTDVIDVGFTGKAVAVAAMHHRDHRGLALPSSIAPIQVGLVSAGDCSDMRKAYASLISCGLRARLIVVGSARTAAWKAERRLQRLSASLVVSNESGQWRLSTRLPLTRRELRSRHLDVASVSDEVRALDSRLAARSRHRASRGVAQLGMLRSLCSRCAQRQSSHLYGWRVAAEHADVRCEDCAASARQAVLLDTQRLY